MIQSIKIEKLFDIFDYDISFQSEENILIITGPNGFGKTKILNIIHSLFNREFSFFCDLVFKKITIILNSDISIEILKFIHHEKYEVQFHFFEKGEKLDFLKLRKDDAKELDKDISIDSGLSIFEKYLANSKNFQEEIVKTPIDSEPQQRKRILDSIKVHLIREQRLLKIEKTNSNFLLTLSEPKTSIKETIQSYSEDLKVLIIESIQNRDKVAQELDSSYPKRLLNETDDIEIEEFKSRFNVLKEKQHKLKVFGISENEQEVPGYSKKNSTALFVYLKDAEKKISVFDELVGKLELFANILNERRLTFKSIKILKDKGFIFITDKGKDLKLTDLSFGEQNEVVLLYELIFNTKENTVLLIDEPEISLHITWQKEFVKDLIKIIKLQKIQVIIATHAPSIINDRWDLVYSLPKPESV
jgi:predicted ATP-binding protein involved in virulence